RIVALSLRDRVAGQTRSDQQTSAATTYRRQPCRGTTGLLCLLTGALLCLNADGRADDAAKPLLDFSQPRTIVSLGDSVTGVYYHTGGVRAYPEMLEVALKKVIPDAKVTVINAGISGTDTANALSRLDRDVLAKKPDLVTITYGLNDLTRIPPEKF